MSICTSEYLSLEEESNSPAQLIKCRFSFKSCIAYTTTKHVIIQMFMEIHTSQPGARYQRCSSLQGRVVESSLLCKKRKLINGIVWMTPHDPATGLFHLWFWNGEKNYLMHSLSTLKAFWGAQPCSSHQLEIQSWQHLRRANRQFSNDVTFPMIHSAVAGRTIGSLKSTMFLKTCLKAVLGHHGSYLWCQWVQM